MLKIRWTNHIKKYGHILNLTWMIYIPKILMSYQRIGKKHFPLWKKVWTHWEFYPYHKTFGQKALKNFLSDVYKFIELVNELKCQYCLFCSPLFFIFSGLCWYYYHFSQDVVDNSHFEWEIYELLDKFQNNSSKSSLCVIGIRNWIISW